MRLRLALVDVDGTLKCAESPYSFLHEALGLAEHGATNRTLARAGAIDYGEWLRRDAALWKGQSIEKVRRILAQNPYLPGAPELLRFLKRSGVLVALVSAGFTINTDPIMSEFELDHCLANVLTTSDGILDGGAINHVPEGAKAAFGRELMVRLGVASDETLAMGDTDGDLELFELAGLKLAVNPRSERLRAQADGVFEPDLGGAVAWLVARGVLPPSPSGETS